MNRTWATQQRFAYDEKVVCKAILVDIDYARNARGVSREEVLAAIEQGEIRWAFNLSSPGAKQIKLIRLYRPSVQEWTNGVLSMDEPSAIERVLNHILPMRRSLWSAAQLARAWNCERDHTVRMVDSGALSKLQKKYKVNESPLIPRDAIIAFMKERVMP